MKLKAKLKAKFVNLRRFKMAIKEQGMGPKTMAMDEEKFPKFESHEASTKTHEAGHKPHHEFFKEHAAGHKLHHEAVQAMCGGGMTKGKK